MIRLSIKTRNEGRTWDELRSAWRSADRHERIDAAWLYDHFIPPFGQPSDPCLEAWTTLAALAVSTKRVRIGVMVTGATYRHPAVLAKMAATVDILSRGRLTLGLGAAWDTREHGAYGITLPAGPERFERLEETCEVLDAMLTRSPANFRGNQFELNEAWCEPPPLQSPRPPFMIGGGGESRTLPIVAKWADMWNLPSGSVEDFEHKLGVLRRHLLDSGREVCSVEPSVQVDIGQDVPAFIDEAALYVRAGANHVVANFLGPVDDALLGRLADEFALRFDYQPGDDPNGKACS